MVPEGLGDVMCEANRVRSRELLYAIFTIDTVKPVRYRVVKTRENSSQMSPRDIITKETLKENFRNFTRDISDNRGYFIVYDFGFYSKDEERFRNVLCLFSIIPDALDVSSKVAFSTSSLQLPGALKVAKHIPFNNIGDVMFENIAKICMVHKPN